MVRSIGSFKRRHVPLDWFYDQTVCQTVKTVFGVENIIIVCISLNTDCTVKCLAVAPRINIILYRIAYVIANSKRTHAQNMRSLVSRLMFMYTVEVLQYYITCIRTY